MFNRNDLTLSLFYASSTNDDDEKVATLTVQVNNTDMVTALQLQRRAKPLLTWKNQPLSRSPR